MPRYVALLRGINVGGHVVKMDRLRAVFSAMGCSDVDTFIASGNVIFSSPSPDVTALERRAEAALKAALGYEVMTFIRTPAQLQAIAAHRPFADEPVAGQGNIYVISLKQPLGAAARRQLMALSTPGDELACKDGEVYWCRRGNLFDSAISGPQMGKALGAQTTTRNRNTIVRLVARLAKDAPASVTRKVRKEKA
jgi:uncharacterized protein (DUF1697 family)